MSESGHSQPGLYGIERRRRWKEPGPGGPQNLSGPGGRERDYIAPWGKRETGECLGPRAAFMRLLIPQSFVKRLPCARDVSVDKTNGPQRTIKGLS